MKPQRHYQLLNEILGIKKKEIEDPEDLIEFDNSFGTYVQVIVIFKDGTIVKHEHVIGNFYDTATAMYIIRTATECFVYRRELVHTVIEKKEE